MALRLKEIHDRLKGIKDNLVKGGPSRRTIKVKEEKIHLANTLYDEYYKVKEILEKDILDNKIKSGDIKNIELLCGYIKSYYKKIKELCCITEQKETIAMEHFDLKTAISLLPIMTDEEKVTKQLISNIEMYDQMLENEGKNSLITFVLKSRLSESAKLRLSETYSSVADLLKDMRQHLLSVKSDTTIQKRLQLAKQHGSSVEDFGKKLEEMFVDLTIAQANGDQSKYQVLKPINEKNAIKIFSDGLRNSRTSVIIASRNYKTLKEAIQGALDEEVHTTGTHGTHGEVLSYHRGRGKSNFYNNRQRGRSNTYKNQMRGRGTYYNNNTYHYNNSHQNNRFENRSSNGTRSRGQGRYYTRGYNNRGYKGQSSHQVNVANFEQQQEDNNQTTETQNLFFRA